MAFEIPDPYAWDESFKVGYKNIDTEHKDIFQAIFACSKNPSSADLIEKLYKVTEDHFKDEEGMMKKVKFPELDIHQQIHNDFLAKIKTLRAPLDNTTVTWAKKWWVGHIKGIDFKYKGKL
ncbi:Myohemerythrin [Lamellibrachia satsuma]|nr:Myohemerythrin [Lamellibrachia satsuma]